VKKIALLSGPLLAGGLLFGLPNTAHALIPDQTCVATESISYSPPITNAPQNITITINGELSPCLNGSAPNGTYSESFVQPNASCTSLLGSATGTRVFDWTNTSIADSTFTYTRIINRVNGTINVTYQGQIVSGSFTPDSALQTMTAPETDLAACSGAGVAHLTFVGTLVIV
jgi:hypothetical protein